LPSTAGLAALLQQTTPGPQCRQVKKPPAVVVCFHQQLAGKKTQ
jgi:hypothetical protein